MGDRAVILSGSFQKVTLGITSKILGAGTYSITGATRKIVDVSEFGVDVDIYEFASSNGGTISLRNVAFDPSDPQQLALQACVEDQVKLSGSSTSGLLFWVNTTSYLVVGTSGHILMTQAGGVEADRNGIARTSFEGQVSGAYMYITAYI